MATSGHNTPSSARAQRFGDASWVRLAAVAMALLGLMISVAFAATEEWPEDWPDEADLEARVARVNEGDLEFIPAPAAEGAHYHQNRIAITEASLQRGWVDLEQCHENIDPVPAAQILFRKDGIRKLAIDRSENIGRAWVEGHSVQLENVGRDAELCVRAQSRALQSLGDGMYRLRNGPYMRRFLDGYYPMRVALEIAYPSDRLRLVGQTPASQEGFRVDRTREGLDVEATFEGRLITCFDFCERGDKTCDGMAPACATSAAR
ncbi:alpha/beta hydrolase [Halochromatium glycolicum]|nr:alpha/beta hydrolase [Halochromatium glycolicum]